MHVSIVSGLLVNGISDHLPIFTVVNYEIAKNNKVSKQYKWTRIQVLHERLGVDDWSRVLSCINVNDAYDHFVEIFKEALNDCCPLRKVTCKPKQKINWITQGIINSCQKKTCCTGSF